MEYSKTFTSCGCQIVISGELHDAEIIYCPKHKAAPMMHEALEAIIVDSAYPKLRPYTRELLNQALAKAEGKEV